VFDDMCVKMGNVGDVDFMYTELNAPVDYDGLTDFIEKVDSREGITLEFDSICRDGCFDEKQLFAVFENQDVKLLISRLKECINKEAN